MSLSNKDNLGFAAKGIISCSTCEKILEDRYLCKRVGGTKFPNTAFDINIRQFWHSELVADTQLSDSGVVS